MRQGNMWKRFASQAQQAFFITLSVCLVTPWKIGYLIEVMRREMGRRDYSYVPDPPFPTRHPNAVKRLLTAHPRWSSQVTPANAFGWAAISVALYFVPPADTFWAVTTCVVLGAIVLTMAIITMRDTYVHLMARALMKEPVKLAKAMRANGFTLWLCWQGGEHLLHLFDYGKNVADFTVDERYWLAAYYQRFLLSDPPHNGKADQALRGACMFGFCVLARLSPKAHERVMAHLRLRNLHEDLD